MTFLKGRRGFPAGPSAVLALLLLTGCAVGGDDLPETSDTPRRDLAGRPAATAAPTTPAGASAAPGASVDASPPVPGSSAAAAPPSAGVSTGTPGPGASAAPTAPYRDVASLDDGQGDNGLGAAPYADLRRISIEDDGRNARVTVAMATRLPTKGADGEAIGIGVDLYKRSGQTESDYQLFADGGPDGWFAYLHTPKGFVRYPGTFALTATGLTFTVPWSSLGAMTGGRFSAFADWTQRRPTGNAAGNDRAPLLGTAAYAR